jgi:hypothetical protein
MVFWAALNSLVHSLVLHISCFEAPALPDTKNQLIPEFIHMINIPCWPLQCWCYIPADFKCSVESPTGLLLSAMTSCTYVVTVAFTRCKHDSQMPHSNLTKYQKGVTYTDINTFNNILPTMKHVNNDTKYWILHYQSISSICSSVYLNLKFLRLTRTCKVCLWLACMLTYAILHFSPKWFV